MRMVGTNPFTDLPISLMLFGVELSRELCRDTREPIEFSCSNRLYDDKRQGGDAVVGSPKH